MKISARVDAGALRRLMRLAPALEAPALDAASDALARELESARERAGMNAPLMRASSERRRFVGADDSDSIARELGTLDRPPAPWLAPALPAVRAPMQAAAANAVARALLRR